MYPTGTSSASASYSDCARPHAPRPGFQSDAAAQIASELGLPSPRDVTFFDLNAPLQKQFCHAALALVPASSLARAGLSVADPSRPAFVAAFRGSSNAAAAIADVNFESAPHAVRGGTTVQVHAGFWESLFGRPGLQTCSATGTGPVPQSCADAVAAKIDQLAAAHGGKGPAQVLVTGHSLVRTAHGQRGARPLGRSRTHSQERTCASCAPPTAQSKPHRHQRATQGAAEAALFALHLDAAGRYDVSAYTYGQPKIGRGSAWRAAYDGPNGLSQRTFRVVSSGAYRSLVASGVLHLRLHRARACWLRALRP